LIRQRKHSVKRAFQGLVGRPQDEPVTAAPAGPTESSSEPEVEDRIKVRMRVSLEWLDDPVPELDPRIPASKKKRTPIIKQGAVLKIADGLAVVQLDDGTITGPTLLGSLTPLP